MHVQIRTDNTTAKSYINNFRGIRSENCNCLAKKIWLWAMSKQIWLSATHVQGVENDPDYESSHYSDNVEWMLNREVVQNIMSLWDKPELDMFASRLSKQLDRYVSWRADPDAESVDAFSMSWENIYFYAFPPFSLIPRLMTKLREDHSECILVAPIWFTQTWFPTVMEHLIKEPYILPVDPKLLSLPGTTRKHPLSNKLIFMVCRLSGKPYKTKTFQNVLQTSSCVHGTQKQYSMYIKKWFDYCHEREINSVQASLSDILDYLASLVERGLSHSAINSARSALSAVGLVRDGFSVGSHPLVIRLVKGAYNMKPPQSHYSETWDVLLVLTYLKTLTPDDELSLKVLTLKLVVLIALVLASRCHSLHFLSMENMRKMPSKYVLRYSGPLKQSRPGIKIPCAELKVFSPDRRISVFHVLEVYLQKTEAIRGNVNSLFISYIKPYKAVSSATIGRWIRSVMSSSGIDCEKYKAHSVRSASASKAKFCQIPIQDIMKTAGWSSSRTFSQFYDKKVDNTDYSSTILNNQSA